MISVIAFLCALSVGPAECGRTTAVDVIAFPDARNELMCMRDAQATLAELAIRADAEHRWIVECSRSLGPVG
jgi:hypothetical protein